MIREKYEAESMTPAANPNKISFVLRETVLPTKIGNAPTAVIRPAARLPSKPRATTFIPASHYPC